ncbi:MAG: hypothetical protein HYU54_01225 [Actinobacteria bacterium]|nr:hypothetical protein [Actinomycetota bacterium]
MRARARMTLAVVPLLLVAGCGGGGGGGGGGEESRRSVHLWVALSDFAIAPAQGLIGAGSVTFTVQNTGTVEHEMEVFRTDLDASNIPVRDGRIVEDVPGLEEIGEVEADPGYADVVTLDLSPGRYLLICNVPGHFQNGMWTEIEVG